MLFSTLPTCAMCNCNRIALQLQWVSLQMLHFTVLPWVAFAHHAPFYIADIKLTLSITYNAALHCVALFCIALSIVMSGWFALCPRSHRDTGATPAVYWVVLDYHLPGLPYYSSLPQHKLDPASTLLKPLSGAEGLQRPNSIHFFGRMNPELQIILWSRKALCGQRMVRIDQFLNHSHGPKCDICQILQRAMISVLCVSDLSLDLVCDCGPRER